MDGGRKLPNPPGGGSWLPYAGFLLMVAGYVYQAGQLSNQIESNTGRIVKLEARQDAVDRTVAEINVRGAQSATKLDFLVERAKDNDRGDNGR